MKTTLNIIIIISLSGCRFISNIGNTPNQTYIKGEIKNYYFTEDIFQDSTKDKKYAARHVDWYSKYLYLMKEPKLYNDTSGNDIYRFTWLRSFDNPIVIRIEKTQQHLFLIYKELGWSKLFRTLIFKKCKKISLSKDQFSVFNMKLNQIGFWNSNTNSNDIGTDGARWILEVKENNKYHVVDRYSPRKGSDFYECCDILIGYANTKIPSKYKY